MLFRLIILLLLYSSSIHAIELHDGHIHYNQDIWNQLQPEDALRLLKENGIQKAIVSSTPTTGTEKLYRLAPDMVIPFLRPYRMYRDRFTWHSDNSIVDYIKQQLDKNFYQGFGEFHLFKEHKDTAVIQNVMQLVAQHKLVISAHSDAETIEHLLNMQPSITTIWAHCGMDHPVTDIEQLLRQYPRLYCELSFREGITDEEETLTMEWKQLIKAFPDRFITGSDTHIPRRWADLPAITEHSLHWLNQLDPAIQTLIAQKNLNRLFTSANDNHDQKQIQ